MDLLWIGLALGLTAGVSPGPLLALVVTASLERGASAGFRVALAPLLTDLPIILLTVSTLRTLPDSILSAIGILGGCLVIALGIRTLRRRDPAEDRDRKAGTVPRDLWQGALVNILNPHPWIFWMTVQGPLLLTGWRRSPWIGVGFVIAFYVAIVGSKMAIAWLVGRGRHALTGEGYRRTLVASGILLLVMGAVLIAQSLQRLG